MITLTTLLAPCVLPVPPIQAMAAGGKVYVTLYGQPQPAGARGGAADAYQAETRAVLQQLDDLMTQVNAAKETLLTVSTAAAAQQQPRLHLAA
jgi:hypothetical protein